jgi:hypothetical protein
MQEVLRLPNALGVLLLGEVPLLDILLEDGTFPLDEVGEQPDQQQLVLALDALRVQLVHLHDRFYHLRVTHDQDVVVLQFGGRV